MSKPTLPSIILGHTLRKLREEKGISLSQLAAKCRFGKSKLSDIEQGKRAVSLFDTAGICRMLEVPPEQTKQLERMATDADTPGWWEPYSTYMLEDFSMFLELEQVCKKLFVFESELITGLLQTARYAQAINKVWPVLDQSAQLQSVDLRATRQNRFWSRDQKPEICIIMHETALTKPVCGEEGDAEQRARILETAEMKGVDIRIVPQAVGAHPSMKGSYTILESGIEEISDAVYTEGITGARYEETEEALSACRTFFDATREKSIPVKEFFNEHGQMA